MCGITGAFQPNNGEICVEDILVAMRDRMAHRGPDGAGVWRAANGCCGLAHRRLSIIDLSERALQPMSNHDESVVLVFNGEIYNHADIRKDLEALGKYRWKTDHSDTEVILHAYEEWGLDCIHRFYGMFAFAIFDNRNPERPVMHLVRDRIGIKPLYLTKTNRGEWLFASEIRALFAHPDCSPELDRTSFWHYLTFIVSPAPLTMFRSIFKIPAGYTVTIDRAGRATARQYWDCKPDRNETYTEADLSEDEAREELTRLLKKSIERRMVSDVPFGVLLSGGVDSSLTMALMSELMDRPVKTFTIGYKGQDTYNEFQYAKQISQRYGTDHHERLIDRQEVEEFLPLLVQLQDEPIADNVCIPLYFLAELVRQNDTPVVQVGEGADETFLGYWWCEHFRAKAETVYDPIREAILSHNDPQQIDRSFNIPPEDNDFKTRAMIGQELFWGGATCWTGEMRRQLTPNSEPFRQEIDCPVEGLLPRSHQLLDSHAVVAYHLNPLAYRLAEPEVLQKIPYMEMKLRLPEHLLMRVDKLTMAHAIEARVPFLDHDVVNFASRLPPSYKLRDGVGKFLLKKTAEPYLDREIVYRKKQGFGAPMEEWFKQGKFGKRCLAAFDRSAIKKEGFFDNQYFTDLLKFQMKRGGGYSFHLWTVLNAILWHESWIEGKQDCF